MASDKITNKVELRKEDLENLLQREIGLVKVKDFTTKPLTNPGDNYGSTILSVEVLFYNGNNNLEKLPIVAKLVPESAFLRKVFNIETTFNKEVRAYTLVSPEFYKLQIEKGIPKNEILDVFSKYYGSRSNKQDDISMEADESAVLLMENLKLSGYELRDRRKGLNLEHMEFTLNKLAQFHALGLALKLLKPQVFKDTVLKACEKFKLGTGEEEDENWVESNIASIRDIPEIVPHIAKITKRLNEINLNLKERREDPVREPFATIVHNDFWVNNMMFNYDKSCNEGDEKKSPNAIKFVDFQITSYSSPVRDLIFLLFTSSEDGLLDVHLDHLMQLYHKELTGHLTKLGCDTASFSLEHFMEEVNFYAPKEFYHILFMLNPISADPSNVEETSKMTKDSISKNARGNVYESKVKTMVQKFVANKWL